MAALGASKSSTDTVTSGVDRGHAADAGAMVLTGTNGVSVSDGVDSFDSRLWSQQESHNNRDNYFKSRASLSPTAADTVFSGVLPCPPYILHFS